MKIFKAMETESDIEFFRLTTVFTVCRTGTE